MTTQNRLRLLLAGAGEGLGVSLAQAFAGAGYDVTGLARQPRTSWTHELDIRTSTERN